MPEEYNSHSMNTVNGFFKYRPIRIGWCLRNNDMNTLKKAVRLSYCFWGGNFNPIIPIDDNELANYLIKAFKVDLLYSVNQNDNDSKNFVDQYKHLNWSFFEKELFKHSFGFYLPNFLDVNVPATMINQKRIIYNEIKNNLLIVKSDENDPLKNLIDIEYGALPSNKEIDINYKDQLEDYFNVIEHKLNIQDKILSIGKKELTIPKLTRFELTPDSFFYTDHSGYYIGDVSNTKDLINYWNLKASNIAVKFYDINFPNRFEDIYKSIFKKVASKLTSPVETDYNYVSLWYSDQCDIDMELFKETQAYVRRKKMLNVLWNGVNNIVPPFFYFSYNNKLGINVKKGESETINFPVTDIPRVKNNEHSKFVISYITYNYDTDSIFNPPNISELNPFFAAKILFELDSFRVGDEFDNIISKADINQIKLYALKTKEFLDKLFEIYDLRLKISIPGLIAHRIIEQLGGLMGCRILRVEGFRKLISEFKPETSLHKTLILERICGGDINTNIKEFKTKYEDLYFLDEITPHLIFNQLLAKNIFRVGLDINCKNCSLTSWKNIDDLKTNIKCEYCGAKNNILLQLKDRDWKYRRTGIFGNNDNQSGAIPTILTLLALDNAISNGKKFFYTSIEINNLSNNKIIEKQIEVDFVFMNQKKHKPFQIVIGECKTKDFFNENGLNNLIKLKKIFEQKEIQVFILLSKLDYLSPSEISLIRGLDKEIKNQLIVFDHEELDYQFLYDKKSKKFGMKEHAISLEDMVKNTSMIYFKN